MNVNNSYDNADNTMDIIKFDNTAPFDTLSYYLD
jgi:hypothetical protein